MLHASCGRSYVVINRGRTCFAVSFRFGNSQIPSVSFCFGDSQTPSVSFRRNETKRRGSVRFGPLVRFAPFRPVSVRFAPFRFPCFAPFRSLARPRSLWVGRRVCVCVCVCKNKGRTCLFRCFYNLRDKL